MGEKPIPRNRLIQRRAVAERFGVNVRTIKELERRGEFPQSIYISERIRAYDSDAVEAWLKERTRS